MWNNSANKFFDALASGTPVLINSGGWQAELIEKEEIGIVTYGLSLNEAAVKIDQFLHNNTKLEISSKNAKKVSKSFFDKNNLTNDILDVLLAVKND